MPSDDVRVVVSGSEFRGWYDVDIDSDVFSAADGFSLTAEVPERRYLGLFREGNRVDVYVGPDRQMAGVIDEMTLDGNRARSSLSISGRDLGAFLVDSEAKAERFSNYTLGELAKHLLKPEWGIKDVIVSNEDNRRVLLGKKERERYKPGKQKPSLIGATTVRRHTKLDPGQTIRQILDEHCMRERVWWWLTADGNLFIGRPQYDQQTSFEFFLYGPPNNAREYRKGAANRRKNNVLEWKVARGMHERYSEIVVVGESSQGKSGAKIYDDNAQDVDDVSPAQLAAAEASKKRAKKFRGVATDPDLVQRGINRRLIITDNDALSSQMCESKAKADMEKRRLSGLVITLTVDDFRVGGRLITTDCLARVVIEEAGIDGVYWISQRRFREDRQSRRTTLTLHEKGVWLA